METSVYRSKASTHCQNAWEMVRVRVLEINPSLLFLFIPEYSISKPMFPVSELVN